MSYEIVYYYNVLRGKKFLFIIYTIITCFRFLGTGPNITVVDTPGFKDTEDAEFVDELMNVLGDEVNLEKNIVYVWNILMFMSCKDEYHFNITFNKSIGEGG